MPPPKPRILPQPRQPGVTAVVRAGTARRAGVLALASGGLLLASSVLAFHGPAPPSRQQQLLNSTSSRAALHALAPSQALPAVVEQALQLAGVTSDNLALYVQAVDGTRPLLALHAEQTWLLASTTKVVTTLAALDLLGPAFRWRTRALLQGSLAEGRLNGNLLLIGGGNARLSSKALAQWFRQLHDQGLHHIDGDIVLDRLAFHLEPQDHAPTPLPSPQRPHHSLPSALTLGDGVLRVDLLPGPAGGLPSLTLDPPLSGVAVVNQLSLARGCSAQARLTDTDAGLQLQVSGAWPLACGPRSLPYGLLSDADLTPRAIAALWRQAGGSLQGEVIERSVQAASPKTADEAVSKPFAMHLSERLPQLLMDINKHSDNLASRSLLLSLSPGFPQRAATLGGAQARVQQWLLGKGLAEGDIVVQNGSGLSRSERGKPRALVHLLRQAWYHPSGHLFVASLPVAGVDGTLAWRMQNGPARGQAQLKTGTLSDAVALAGYVRSRSGKVYALAAMLNHADAGRATPALDALVEWLVENG